MECQDAFELLSADVDGELSSKESELLAFHLRSCANCARNRALLASTRQAFYSMACKAGWRGTTSTRRIRFNIPSARWIAIAPILCLVLAFVLFRVPRTSPELQSSLSFMRSTAGNMQPGWNEGRMDIAKSCGLVGTVGCVIETPCFAGECISIEAVGRYGR